MPIKQRSVVFPARSIDIRITCPEYGDWRFTGSTQLKQALNAAAEVILNSEEPTGTVEIAGRFGCTVIEWSAATVRDTWADTAKHWLKMALCRPLDVVRNLISAKWGN